MNITKKIKAFILLTTIISALGMASCKKDNNNSSSGDGNPTGELDPDLVGEWLQSYTSTIEYSDGGGNYSEPSGVQVALRFYANGHYESDFFNQSSLYNCTITMLGLRKGHHHIDHTDGKTMYIDEESSTLKTIDNCRVANNTNKNIALKKIKYAYTIAVDPADHLLKLHLKTASGEDDVFYKAGQ